MIDLHQVENNNQPFINKIRLFLDNHHVNISTKFVPNYDPSTLFTHWLTTLTRIDHGYKNAQEFAIEQNISMLDSYHQGELTETQQMDARKLAIQNGLAIKKFFDTGCHDVGRLPHPDPAHILMKLIIKSRSIHSPCFESWAINNFYAINDLRARPAYQDHVNTAIRFNSLFSPVEIKEIEAILHHY